MRVAFILLAGLLGAAVGSFLNVVIDRLPEGQSLLSPPSHCSACGRRLAGRDLIPIVSYLALGGRCRRCGALIPKRILVVEVVTALAFAGLAWYRGPGFDFVADAVYAAVFIVVAAIDLEHMLILNRVIYPAVGAALGLAALRVWWGEPRFLYEGYWLAMGWAPNLAGSWLGLMSQVAGGALATAIFLLIRLLAPQGMGDGDVRLAAFSGLITGFPGVLGAVFGSFILGGLVGAGLLLAGRASRRTALPFAPFLVAATLLISLSGDQLLMRYLAALGMV